MEDDELTTESKFRNVALTALTVMGITTAGISIVALPFLVIPMLGRKFGGIPWMVRSLCI